MNPDNEDHKALALWAADCAERVLPYFEEQHPEDDRPRKAIEAVRAWVRREIKVGEARTAAFAAHAAAREADEGSARQAARATGHAAATAHVPTHAPHAADYAVKSVALASTDASAVEKERDWQYQRLPEHLWQVVFPSQKN